MSQYRTKRVQYRDELVAAAGTESSYNHVSCFTVAARWLTRCSPTLTVLTIIASCNQGVSMSSISHGNATSKSHTTMIPGSLAFLAFRLAVLLAIFWMLLMSSIQCKVEKKLD